MENEELIRQRMEDTRESLTDKLETLEDKLVSSVRQATSAVTETVASVKETVGESVETVKDAVDIPAHVERHPWLAVGGAVACGYMLGSLLARDKKAPDGQMAPPPPPSGNGRRDQATHGPRPQAGGLADVLEPEIRQLKSLALGAALGTVREMLAAEVPPHMAEQVRDIIDGVTKKMGADPIPSSDWTAPKPATPPPGAQQECGERDTSKAGW